MSIEPLGDASGSVDAIPAIIRALRASKLVLLLTRCDVSLAMVSSCVSGRGVIASRSRWSALSGSVSVLRGQEQRPSLRQRQDLLASHGV